jgi:hypothetical protein
MTASGEGKALPFKYVDLRYTYETYIWQRRSLFVTETPILSSEKVLHKDYDRKGLVAK